MIGLQKWLNVFANLKYRFYENESCISDILYTFVAEIDEVSIVVLIIKLLYLSQVL